MFNFKRKDITPVQSQAKKATEEPEVELLTPIRPTQNDTPLLPKPNRSRQQSIRSAASVASFKSINEISIKNKKMELTEFDLGATRTGRHRDMIEIDVFMIDGEPYTAQISEIEAYKLIYRKALDLDRAIFHGARLFWAAHPLIVFRTKELIDIDKLPKTFEYLKPDFDKDGNDVFRKVICEIRGVRDPNKPAEERRGPTPEEDEFFPKMRWIKIEGAGYDIKQGFLERMLDHFGERQTKIEVEVIEFADSESETEDAVVSLSTGNMSVKVELMKDMPQFIPLYGRRVKIHYRGIKKACNKCYHLDHASRDCRRERVTMVNYAEEFMNAFPDFPKDLYGNWSRLVEVNKRAKRATSNTATSK